MGPHGGEEVRIMVYDSRLSANGAGKQREIEKDRIGFINYYR